MKEELRQAILQAMEEKANELKVTGVAGFMLVTPGAIPDILDMGAKVVGRFERDADPERDKPRKKDRGTNYMGVMFTKMAEMLSTKKNSGTSKERKPKVGETGYPGGVTFEVNGYFMLIAFSGGTGEDDREVSRAGEAAFWKNFDGK